jgi:1,4-dihydroxy-2-naphthoyl-CoA hydrolase
MNDSIWFFHPPLEQLNQTADTMLGRLGIEFTEIGNDYVSARMPVDHRTHQPYGLLHGGASVTLAETLGSTGAYMCVDPKRYLVVGIEINANHVRGIREGWVTGTARPLHRGKTTQLWEIKITDEAGKLVCVSRITVAILEKKPAA